MKENTHKKTWLKTTTRLTVIVYLSNGCMFEWIPNSGSAIRNTSVYIWCDSDAHRCACSGVHALYDSQFRQDRFRRSADARPEMRLPLWLTLVPATAAYNRWLCYRWGRKIADTAREMRHSVPWPISNGYFHCNLIGTRPIIVHCTRTNVHTGEMWERRIVRRSGGMVWQNEPTKKKSNIKRHGPEFMMELLKLIFFFRERFYALLDMNFVVVFEGGILYAFHSIL